MSAPRRIAGIAKADFLERVRKFSFFACAALLAFAVFWFVPRPSGFTALVIEPDRFLQGSDPSWVPMASAMCGGMLLCLVGFVYVKNAVRRDRELGILSLVQTSPLKRSAYLFGKLLSNTLLLLLFLCCIAAASFLTMEIRFPGKLIPLYAFVSPFLCVAPGLLFVSALALLTDCAPLFRGSSGLSAAVFACLFILLLTLGSLGLNPYRLTSVFDFSGYLWMRDSISEAARAATGQPVTRISVFTDSHESGSQLKALAFGGLTPSASYLADKLVLIAVSFLLTFVSSLLLPKWQKAVPEAAAKGKTQSREKPARVPRFRYGLTRSEASILLKGRPAFWWAAAAGFWLAGCFAPMDSVRGTIFPLAFVWTLPVFSQMGCLEHRTGVVSVLRAMPNGPFLHALFCWKAGFAVSFVTALPALLRCLASGNFADVVSVLVFSFVLPCAALCLGEWTKSNRPFEIFFLLLCYMMLEIPSFVFPGGSFTRAAALRLAGAALAAGAALFLTLTGKAVSPRTA